MCLAHWSSWPGMACWMLIQVSISILPVETALVSCVMAFCWTSSEAAPASIASLKAR